jgi:outer membrane protein assembly factor BamB
MSGSWLLLIGVALASPTYRSVFEPSERPAPLTYPGEFAAKPVPHWVVDLPGGVLNSAAHTERTRPAVWGGYLFVGSAAGQALYMLDRRNGSTIRSFPASASVESEPVVDGEHVWFSDTGGSTWCYAIDGTLRWQHVSKAPILVRPTLHQGRIYVTNVDDLVLAIDAATGEVVWRYQQRADVTRRAELSLYAAPPAVVLGEEVLVGFSDGAVVALDAGSGDVIWSQRVGLGRYPDLVAEPNADAALVFVAGYFEPLVAIERTTHKVRWTLPHGAAAGALLHGEGDDAVLFHPGSDGTLRAIVASSGRLLWEWASGTSGALTQPVWTGAGLLVASSNDTVTLLSPVDGSVRWVWSPPLLMEGVAAAPVVAGRQLLFTSNAGRLYSLLSPEGEVYTEPERPRRKKRRAVTVGGTTE